MQLALFQAPSAPVLSAPKFSFSPWIDGEAPGGVAVAGCATSLGPAAIGLTERGVCALWLGDDAALVQAQVLTLFSDAHVVEPTERHQAAAAAVDDPRLGADLVVDPRGTWFQQRVWAVLRQIPVGAVVSYAQVGAAIGGGEDAEMSASDEPDPGRAAGVGLARAVGAACGANRVAVLVPCHRVVRTDGSWGGFRWGVERKTALLARERPGRG